MSKNSKNNFYYIIVLVLTLSIFVVAATFAYFNFVASREKDSTKIYTGIVSIDYIQGTLIEGKKIIPAVNENGVSIPPYEAIDNVYKNTFRIKNDGTLPVTFLVKLDILKNTYETDNLHYIIYDEYKNSLATGSLNKSGIQTLVENVSLDVDKEKEYTLIIWLVETGDVQNEDQGKNFLARISADAIQQH